VLLYLPTARDIARLRLALLVPNWPSHDA